MIMIGLLSFVFLSGLFIWKPCSLMFSIRYAIRRIKQVERRQHHQLVIDDRRWVFWNPNLNLQLECRV